MKLFIFLQFFLLISFLSGDELCSSIDLGTVFKSGNGTSMDGILREGYGVSNNAKAKLGSPKFEAVKFFVSGPSTVIQLQMSYF